MSGKKIKVNNLMNPSKLASLAGSYSRTPSEEFSDHYQQHPGGIGGYDRNDDIQKLLLGMNQLGEIVNNHTSAISVMSNKIGEMGFRLGKMDSQIQIFRNSIRKTRDDLVILKSSLEEAGIVDRHVFNIIEQILEKKLLPISSDGRANIGLGLSRYNHNEVAPLDNNKSDSNAAPPNKRVMNIKRGAA